MCGSDEGVASNITCTWPAKRSVSAGDEPRYGTWTISTPAIILNSSPTTWCVEPLPADAMLILPGVALGVGVNSGQVLGGPDGFTSMMKQKVASPLIGAMSRMKSKFS